MKTKFKTIMIAFAISLLTSSVVACADDTDSHPNGWKNTVGKIVFQGRMRKFERIEVPHCGEVNRGDIARAFTSTLGTTVPMVVDKPIGKTYWVVMYKYYGFWKTRHLTFTCHHNPS